MEFVVFGLLTGSALLLATVGFSMIRRIEGFANIAHGQMLAVGAYIAYALNSNLKWDIIPAAIVAIIGTAIVGWLVARIIFFPVRKAGPLMLIITSVGGAYIIHAAIEAIFGVRVKQFQVPPMRSFRLGDTAIAAPDQVAMVVVTVLSALALHVLLTRTETGKAIRAMANDFDLARIRGINTSRLRNYVWLIASGLGGLAGVMLGLIGRIYPDMGWAYIMTIFVVAVLGGLGSIYGVMAAAIIIGLATSLSVMVLPSQYSQSIAFVIVILVLLVRPRGIFREV